MKKLNAEQEANVAKFHGVRNVFRSRILAAPGLFTSRESFTEAEVREMLEEVEARTKEAYASRGRVSAPSPFPGDRNAVPRRTSPSAPRTAPGGGAFDLEAAAQSPEVMAELRSVERFARSGVLDVQAMSVDEDPGGGFLVPPGSGLDREIGRVELDATPMRQVARVISVDNEEYAKLMSMGDGVGGWVGEREARPETLIAALKKVAPFFGEVYAFPFITQKLLDDAGPVEIVAWLAEEVGSIFAQQENVKFINGDGVKGPRGLLTYPIVAAPTFGQLKQVKSGSAGLVVADKLLEVVYSLRSAYRRNAVWMMSSTTQLLVRQLKDGQNNYLWKAGAEAGQPATLMGFPVVENDQMPNPSAGSNSIAFGDFRRGYKIADLKYGIRVLRDDLTQKPYCGFYSTKRLGGGVEDSTAIIIHTLAV